MTRLGFKKLADKKCMKIIYLALSVVAFTGCVNRPVQQYRPISYTKEGATQADFMKDRYTCLQETQQRVEASRSAASASGNFFGSRSSTDSVVMPTCGAFASCLAAKGYFQDDEGELVIPKGTAIPCR